MSSTLFEDVGIEGQITASVYDVTTVTESRSEWDTLSEEAKYSVLTDATPTNTIHSCNVTVNGLHEYLARNLDPTQTTTRDNVNATHVGIGNDAGSGISESDTQLNNLLESKQALDSISDGSTLTTFVLLDSTEANGKTVDEIGLASGDLNTIATDDTVFLLNHASFTPIEKDNTRAITFKIELLFNNS